MSDGAMFFLQGNSDYFHDPRRIAIENELIWRRDANVTVLNRGNGAVVRAKDGSPSDRIRMGMEDVLRVADEHDPVRAAVVDAVEYITTCRKARDLDVADLEHVYTMLNDLAILPRAVLS